MLQETHLTIDCNRARAKRPKKSRVFSARLLGLLGDMGDPIRPYWLALAGPPTTLAPFVANFRAGKIATHYAWKVRVPKTAGHLWSTVHHPRGSITLVYDPALMQLSPPLADPEKVAFLLMPSDRWLTAARREAPDGIGDLDLVASLFAAYVDRRVDLPILRDPRFHRQLFDAAIESELLQERDISSEHWATASVEAMGFRSLWSCFARRDAVVEFIKKQVALWREEHAHGETRIQTNSWILPDPPSLGDQLSFDF